MKETGGSSTKAIEAIFTNRMGGMTVIVAILFWMTADKFTQEGLILYNYYPIKHAGCFLMK